MKLLAVSTLVEVVGFVLWLLTIPFVKNADNDFSWLFFTLGFVFYGLMYARYRNKGARHFHEKDTKATTDNMRTADNFVTKRTGLRNTRMEGANNASDSGGLFGMIKGRR